MGDNPNELASLCAERKKALVIANAIDNFPNERQRFLDFQSAELQKLGFEVLELDLRNHFHGNDLHAALASVDLVWTLGGNSFLLRRAMRQSRFDEVALPSIKGGKLTYGGFSAGAIVACPTLRGVELADAADALAPGYNGEIVWDGLGLIDYSIVPHFNEDHRDYATMLKIADYLEKNGLPFKTIKDGEAIIVGATE